MIATVIPRSAVGNKFLLLHVKVEQSPCLQANLSALIPDYRAQHKHSGASLKYHVVTQLPVVPPAQYDEDVSWCVGAKLDEWVTVRVLELSYTASDLQPYARSLGGTRWLIHGRSVTWPT
jgi:hypothetical protein